MFTAKATSTSEAEYIVLQAYPCLVAFPSKWSHDEEFSGAASAGLGLFARVKCADSKSAFRQFSRSHGLHPSRIFFYASQSSVFDHNRTIYRGPSRNGNLGLMQYIILNTESEFRRMMLFHCLKQLVKYEPVTKAMTGSHTGGPCLFRDRDLEMKSLFGEISQNRVSNERAEEQIKR